MIFDSSSLNTLPAEFQYHLLARFFVWSLVVEVVGVDVETSAGEVF